MAIEPPPVRKMTVKVERRDPVIAVAAAVRELRKSDYEPWVIVMGKTHRGLWGVTAIGESTGG